MPGREDPSEEVKSLVGYGELGLVEEYWVVKIPLAASSGQRLGVRSPKDR